MQSNTFLDKPNSRLSQRYDFLSLGCGRVPNDAVPFPLTPWVPVNLTVCHILKEFDHIDKTYLHDLQLNSISYQALDDWTSHGFHFIGSYCVFKHNDPALLPLKLMRPLLILHSGRAQVS